jgi:hypothetical protein
VVAFLLELRDALLELLESLSLSLTRLSSGEGVASSLHGNNISGVLHNDWGERLISLASVDPRDG